jgi:rubredoxin
MKDGYKATVGECNHNAMVDNNDPMYAWKCADCGYVYGKGENLDEMLSAANAARYKALQAKKFGRIDDEEKWNKEADRIMNLILNFGRVAG